MRKKYQMNTANDIINFCFEILNEINFFNQSSNSCSDCYFQHYDSTGVNHNVLLSRNEIIFTNLLLN